MINTCNDSLSFKHHLITDNDHSNSDYFSVIKELIQERNIYEQQSNQYRTFDKQIQTIYSLVEDEIINNTGAPVSPIKFGTSGWRGILGKEIFCKSIELVTNAIISIYENIDRGSDELIEALGINSFEEAKKKGCVIGFDNRFAGDILAKSAVNALTSHGITVHYAGEATTGTLSAAVLVLDAAFSINLTPSHNPLEYGGFKYNAADAGPASPVITNEITANASKLLKTDFTSAKSANDSLIHQIDALSCWQQLVRENQPLHGLDYDQIIDDFLASEDIVIAIDCVHGASRVHIPSFFKNAECDRIILNRSEPDPTFGGIAPEPSSENMQPVLTLLGNRKEPLKLGMIIDPDADRIRFTDGSKQISMNQFGAMAYHYLHEIKGKNGLVAKTVATSNFANSLSAAFGEETFEPPVGFKNFKPVIGKALVYFEESDGISVIGHTPEKDAYIGLLLAIDMTLTLNKNLGDYQSEIESQYGAFFPDRDGVAVSVMGEELLQKLAKLDHYVPGKTISIGTNQRTISKIIDIDGYKIIFEDGSWLMIRPSGTEPKVRFYVEGRTKEDQKSLVDAAQNLLKEIGLL